MSDLNVLKIVREPTINKWTYADLGDEPDQHRWRAQWVSESTTGVYGIHLDAYPVLSKTRCGVWINEYGYRQATKQPWEEGAPAKEWVPFDQTWMKKRFVHDNSNQAWAKPTQEEAIKSLAVRLCRWAGHVARDTEKVRTAAETISKLRPDLNYLAEGAIKNLKG
jgi:hypothetical protein